MYTGLAGVVLVALVSGLGAWMSINDWETGLIDTYKLFTVFGAAAAFAYLFSINPVNTFVGAGMVLVIGVAAAYVSPFCLSDAVYASALALMLPGSAIYYIDGELVGLMVFGVSALLALVAASYRGEEFEPSKEKEEDRGEPFSSEGARFGAAIPVFPFLTLTYLAVATASWWWF